MEKDEIRYVMVGTCPNCGTEFIRPPECDVATCECKSVTTVPLRPALLLPPRIYAKVDDIAKQNGFTVEAVVNALLDLAIEEYKRTNILEVTQVG